MTSQRRSDSWMTLIFSAYWSPLTRKSIDGDEARQRLASGAPLPLLVLWPVPVRDEHTNIAEIPEGKANLIRAAFGAGLKTPAIARTFGISLSQVNRVIRSTGKPHR